MTHAATQAEVREILEQVADNGRLPSDIQEGVPAMAERINKLVEALEELDKHIDFYTPIESGVCQSCGNGWDNADGINQAMKNAHQALADYRGTKE